MNNETSNGSHGANGLPNSTPAPAADPELQIIIMRDDYVAYLGSRAQLEAEGIIPADLVWPSFRNSATWVSAGLKFELYRRLPDGVRRSSSFWVDGDFWCLQIWPVGYSPLDYPVRAKVRELRCAIWQSSHEGRAEFSRIHSAWMESRSDVRFQAFKAKIPALCKPSRRSRKGRPGTAPETSHA